MLLPDDPARAFMPYPPVAVANAGAGPLAGLSFAVKDLFDVVGYRTSAGSPTMLAMSEVKRTTAPAVQRLLDAGAAFVGKTLTDELAFSMTGRNAHFGTPINGGAPDRIPGGSSSGSASAVSNRLCDFALGTDTGGSVRAPASFCGLFGLRPTHGAISLAGCHDLSPSFDTCGFFARDAETFARVADVLLPPGNGPDAAVRPLAATDLFDQLEAAVRDALAPAVRRVSAICGEAAPLRVIDGDPDGLYEAYRVLQGYEAWRTDGAMITRHRPPLGPGIAERFEWCSRITPAQVEAAGRVRDAFRRRLADRLGVDGVMVLPTQPDVAPRRDADEATIERFRAAALHLLCAAGMSGLPQLTLPLATRDGAPLGLSLLGPAGADRRLVALARRIASAGLAG